MEVVPVGARTKAEGGSAAPEGLMQEKRAGLRSGRAMYPCPCQHTQAHVVPDTFLADG